VFLQALHCVPFFGIGSDCGMLPGYKIDSLEPQPYVHDRVNGCQSNSRSWWQRSLYFAIGPVRASQKEGAFKSCGPQGDQAGSVKLSLRQDDVSAAYSGAVPNPIRGRDKYLRSTCNSCDFEAGRVGSPTAMTALTMLRSWLSTAGKVRIRVKHYPGRINVRKNGDGVCGVRAKALGPHDNANEDRVLQMTTQGLLVGYPDCESI